MSVPSRKLYRRSSAAELRDALRSGRIRVAVYGLGHTGTSLSIILASVTKNVVAVDSKGTRVAAVRRGRSPVSDEPCLSRLLQKATDAGALQATADAEHVAEQADVHVVTVPVGLRDDDAADLSPLRTVIRHVGSGLSPGDLVVVGTMVPPGTTRGLVRSVLLEESGVGSDAFGLVACALPLDRRLRSVRNGDVVVGGCDGPSSTAGAALFEEVTHGRVAPVDAPSTAECVSILERTVDEIGRAAINELATNAGVIGSDVRQAVELVNDRGTASLPSPGVDDREPIGAGFVRDAVVGRTPVLDSAYAAAREFPGAVAETIADTASALGDDDVTVLVLGLPLADEQPSENGPPAVTLVRELVRNGTRPLVCDPTVDLPRSLVLHAIDIEAARDLSPEAVVVLASRPIFERLEWREYADAFVVDCSAEGLPEEIPIDVRRFGSPDSWPSN